MKKLLRLLTTFWQILLGQLSVTAPEEFLIQKISPDYNLEQVLRELIHELRTKQFGKIRINKKGFCCDENGIRVPALCLRAGEIRVHDTLFILRIVYEREQNELYLLLVRSDCRTPLYRLFPQIGNEQDWRVLSKCERYFSPHCSYSRRREKQPPTKLQQNVCKRLAGSTQLILRCLRVWEAIDCSFLTCC